MLSSRGGAKGKSRPRSVLRNAASKRKSAGLRQDPPSVAFATVDTPAGSSKGDQTTIKRPARRTDIGQGVQTSGNGGSPAPKQRLATPTTAATFQERYQLLKRQREVDRVNAIKDGFLADPDRPRTLAEAITPVGTCQDMCPEFERVERVVQNDVWSPETQIFNKAVAPTGSNTAPDEARMVKKFRRAAAGIDEQLPSDLRPPLVLERTIDYLFNEVIDDDFSLANVHHFVWDRTRAVRNDFSIQQVSKLSELRIAIACYERIARFHILSLHQFARRHRPYDKYDAQQEREQLDKTLLSLVQYYDDSRGRYESPNEAEFRAYCIIFQIQDPVPDLEDRVQSWPVAITKHPRVQRALTLYAAACSTSDGQGPLRPRANHPIAQANWSRFWSLVGSSETSYLMACVAEIYFGTVRRNALKSIWHAYRQGGNKSSEDWTLGELLDVLGFDDESRAEEFCTQYGFSLTEGTDGSARIDLNSVQGKSLPEPASFEVFGQIFSDFVEQKRYNRTFPAVINGFSVRAAQSAGMVKTEDPGLAVEKRSNASLFVSDHSDDEDMDVDHLQRSPDETYNSPHLDLNGQWTATNPGSTVFQPKSIQSSSSERKVETSKSGASSSNRHLEFNGTANRQSSTIAADVKEPSAFQFSPPPGPLTSRNPFSSAASNFSGFQATSKHQDDQSKPSISLEASFAQGTVPPAIFRFGTPLYGDGSKDGQKSLGHFASAAKTGDGAITRKSIDTSESGKPPDQAPKKPHPSSTSLSSPSVRFETAESGSISNRPSPPKLPNSTDSNQSRPASSIPSADALAGTESRGHQAWQHHTTPPRDPVTSTNKPFSNQSSPFDKRAVMSRFIGTRASPSAAEKQSRPPFNASAGVKQNWQAGVLTQLARTLILEPSGLLDQYVEHVATGLVHIARQQVEQESHLQEADDFRMLQLYKRFAKQWKETCWNRRLARRGKERRERLARDMETKATSRDDSSKSRAKKEEGKAEGDRFDGRGQTVSQATGAREQTAIGGSETDVQPRIRGPDSEARITNVNSPRPVTGGLDFSNRAKDPSLKTLPVSTPQPSELAQSSAGQARLALRRNNRNDTTRSTYFKLKAMGLNPSARTPHGDAAKSASNATLDRRHLLETRNSRIGSSGKEEVSPQVRPLPRPVAGTGQIAYMEDDEGIFAAVRMASQAMNDSISFFRDQTVKHSPASEHRNLPRAGARVTFGERTLFESRAETKNPPPKYRDRVSKFLPREQYADALMQKAKSAGAKKHMPSVEDQADQTRGPAKRRRVLGPPPSHGHSSNGFAILEAIGHEQSFSHSSSDKSSNQARQSGSHLFEDDGEQSESGSGEYSDEFLNGDEEMQDVELQESVPDGFDGYDDWNNGNVSRMDKWNGKGASADDPIEL